MSYHRKQEENRRLKKIYDKTKTWYGTGVYYDEDKGRFIRYSCHDKWTKVYCRRITRRRLKKEEGFCKGCKYKKLYDYWWEIL